MFERFTDAKAVPQAVRQHGARRGRS